MTNPADHYRTCAAALRALLPRLAEPDQQVVVAAALSLDHAAVQAEGMAAMVTWDRESLIRDAQTECCAELLYFSAKGITP